MAVAVFHARGLWPGMAFLPIDRINNYLPWRTGPFDLSQLQNQTVADPIYEYYPYLVHSMEAFKRGEWLLWDSQLLLGHPSLGDPAYQTFYPVLAVLGLVLGAARGLTNGLWLHAALAALLTYGWLRVQDYDRPAACIGALTFALSGYAVTWFETGFFTCTLAWLPGVLWMYELALRTGRWGYASLGALMYGLAILAGQISFVVIFSLFLGAYATGRAVEFSRPGRLLLRPINSAVLILGLGALLGAVQLVPFAEALSLSHRQGGVAFNPIPWQNLVTLIIPDFYGNPSTAFAYWGLENYSEATFYAGLIALLLALTGVISAGRAWERYIGLLGAGLIYYVFGGPGMAQLSTLPIIAYVSPNRSVFLLSLIVALLAASALRPQRASPRKLMAATAGIGVIVVAFVALKWDGVSLRLSALTPLLAQAGALLALALGLLFSRERWPYFRQRLTWALAGLVFVDLYVWGAHFNPALPIAQLPPATPGIQYLQANAGRYRVMTRQLSGDFVFGPNYLSTYGLSDLSLYSSLLPPRILRLIAVGDPGSQGYFRNIIIFGRPSVRLADVLHAGYLVSQASLPDPGVRTEVALGPCAVQGSEIRSDQPLSGAVTPRDSAINRLDVAFRLASPNRPESVFTIRMWRGTARERLVLESTFTHNQIRDRQPLTFFFAPERGAPGQIYVWEISTEAERTGVHACARADGDSDLGLYGVDWMEVYAGEIHLAERLAPLPRAYIVYGTETVTEDEQAVARLLDDAFDIRNIAITDHDLSLPPTDGAWSTPAEIDVYESHRVVIRTATSQPGLLVFGDYFYPGWEVFIDGQPAPLLRVNLVWRGVVTPAGQHVIEYRYSPRSLHLGLWLGGLGLLGTIGLGGFQITIGRKSFRPTR